MRLRALILVLAIGAGGCRASNDSAPPKAQAGSLSEAPVPSTPPPTTPPPEVTPAPDVAPAPAPAPAPPPEPPVIPRKAPKGAPPAKQNVPAKAPGRGSTPSQSVVTRDAPDKNLPPARITRGGDVTPPPPPPARTGYSGPTRGTIRWFGAVEPEGIVLIEGDRSSTGTITGALPGVPVLVQLLSRDVLIVEAPGPANGWRRLSLRSRVRQSALIIQWTVLP